MLFDAVRSPARMSYPNLPTRTFVKYLDKTNLSRALLPRRAAVGFSNVAHREHDTTLLVSPVY